ncbi:DMT family transporter [Lysinibacillus sp. NPDC096418]|uniref:DMT family transporter n=1 Tax=Lysinibacillus sp. NPDC096418 TaxID=3364138 RepID=UPI00382F7724
MGWIYVTLASIFEILGVVGLRFFSQKKTVWNLLLYISGFTLSFILLYQSFQYMQTSIAYIVWVGIGTVGAVVVNILFFGESKNFARLVSIVAIVIGIIGLKSFG